MSSNNLEKRIEDGRTLAGHYAGLTLAYSSAIAGTICYYIGARGVHKTDVLYSNPRTEDLFLLGIGMLGLSAGALAINYFEKRIKGDKSPKAEGSSAIQSDIPQ